MKTYYLSFILMFFTIILCGQENIYKLDITKGENRSIDSWLKAGGENSDGLRLGVNSLFWTKDGKPWLPIMGEFHFVRYPQKYWEDELLKMKAAGISIVSVYVFWVNHEVTPGNYNWKGNNDLRQFLKLCKKHELFVWLRPGPYINAEAKNGGFPDWINKKGKRSNAPWYLAASKKYYIEVAKQTKGFYFKDGGPIIGFQVDNELAHDTKKTHLTSLLNMAKELGMITPFYSATNNSKHFYEKGDIIPMQGAYPYRGWMEPEPTIDFLYSTDEWGAMKNIGGLPYDGTKFPRGMCELGVGCWQSYNNRFVVPSYDSEGHAQNALGRGINLMGYFMFQGGTQKEGYQGNNHPLNYDFQAPIGEYGQIRDSYKKIKVIHNFITDFGSELATMQPARVIQPIKDPTDVKTLRYVGRFKDEKGFLFLTTTQGWVDMKPQENVQIELKLKGEKLLFPEAPITIKENTSPIFPINLDINGAQLKYATAQLLAKVEGNNGVPNYFFFKLPGVNPEFAFNDNTFKKLTSTAETINKNGRTYIKPVPGMGQTIEIIDNNGKKAIIVVLTREQAEQSWRLHYKGKERLFLSNANLLIDKGHLELFSESNKMNLLTFPAIDNKLNSVRSKNNGVFSEHVFETPETNLDIKINKKSTNNWVFNTPKKLPKHVRNIFAYVDYIGSKAGILENGKNYSDDFFNGTIWDIGLRRFMNNGRSEITIKISEWDDKVKGIPKNKAPKNDTERKGLIREIKFKPEYTISLGK
ncbi:beta-galactosidase [Polaribacter haliotis]|uniref:Beta-galactosidase n=1 Tax=Polaribacter haliotis TaxID=1888915 RepID=A0A7L8AFJ2_9FLAO|nr:beta-galactosidase [Polaribacter haliotis]QOD60714.1 beta-galactosidase [Polaribacter haliotis]